MENGCEKWCFEKKEEVNESETMTVRGFFDMLMENLNKDDPRPVIPLSNGDPSRFECFRTATAAEDAIVDAVRSANYNSYAPAVGMLPARRAVAGHLNRDIPYKLSAEEVYLTTGCHQSIEVTLTALAHPGANILLPRPGYPYYEARAACSYLEVRHFDLVPEKGWEVDLDVVVALADENTVAIVIINPGNPCGNVFSYEHLKKIAETARKLGILVIADEVYGHISFGSTQYVPMGVFGSIVPVLTLGSISKRWNVPGWRVGWLVTTDPRGILRKTGIVKSITRVLDVSSDPTTFVQGAIPEIIENTKDNFFIQVKGILREAVDICYDGIKDITCMSCPRKPEGAMSMMVKLNLSILKGINDDIEFCMKLAKEESVLVLPGVAVGLKNWFRITFAITPTSLEEALARIKAFCLRHGIDP